MTDLNNPKKGKYYFPCGQWLAKGEGDGLICRDLMGSRDPLAVRKCETNSSSFALVDDRKQNCFTYRAYEYQQNIGNFAFLCCVVSTLKLLTIALFSWRMSLAYVQELFFAAWSGIFTPKKTTHFKVVIFYITAKMKEKQKNLAILKTS